MARSATSYGHEEMVVVESGHYIAVDSGPSEFMGDGGGQAHRIQGGVPPRDQPPGHVVVPRPRRPGVLLPQHRSEAFAFGHRDDRGHSGGMSPATVVNT